MTKTRHPNLIIIIRIIENPLRLAERITGERRKRRRDRCQIAAKIESVGFGRQIHFVGIRRIDRNGRDAIKRTDLRPRASTIGRAIKSAKSVGRTAPSAPDAHIPSVLSCVVRINHDVLRPIDHSGMAKVIP